jgi:hypothetical protein
MPCLMCFRASAHIPEPMNQDLHDVDTTIAQPDSPIHMDAMDDSPCSASRQSNTKMQTCCGIQVNFPPGMSAHLPYPYGIHDELGDPWDYSVTRGTMILHAKGCKLKAQCMSGHCAACDRLTENGNLQGVLQRIETGVHENTRLTYHSVGGLITIVRRKIGEVCALRLRRLNDVQKLARKAVALDDFKRWVMAVSSGKVERVDRLVRINLARKGGIQNLLDLYDCAARQVYHPRNYIEVDDLRGLLLWQLGSARVAEITYHALHLPSLSTLCCHTLIPRLLVSSLSPGTEC